MKAVVFNAFGNASVLHLTEKAVPEINENEVLIKVCAAGMNRADIAQRKGHYPAPKGTIQNILGLEVSGTIIKKGTKVTSRNIGEEVCALLPGGGYAEYVAVDAGSCLPIPQGMTLENAAGLPEVLFTVWYNIFKLGKLKPQDQVLIYGGSGGIGSMAIQLVHLFGADAIAVAGSEDKGTYCTYLGAKKVVNYTEDLLSQLSTQSIDIILDSVGGVYLDTNLDVLRPEGRLVYINAMNGGHPPLDIFKVMQKRIWITGSTLRSRSLLFKAELAHEIYTKAFPLLESPHFKTLVQNRLPIEKAAEAHALMDSRDFFGKIILYF